MRSRRTFVALAACVVCAAAGCLAGGCGTSTLGVQAAPAPAAQLTPVRTVDVSFSTRRPGHVVPADFAGLSLEMTSVHLAASFGRHGNLPRLLRSLGSGILRIGGVSADTRVAFARRLPGWAQTTIGYSDFNGLRALARRSGWRIILTLNLVHFSPATAAREVSAARRRLGSALAGIEIGNEADAYAQHRMRPAYWSFAHYGAESIAYLRAIRRVDPGIRLAGPDSSGSFVFQTWGPAEARALRPEMLTVHHYPLGCHDTPPPTIDRLLSPWVRARERVTLRRYVGIAQTARVPFAVDEAGSVSCGGTAGVSNTFASALWASAFIAHAMAAGAGGVYLHGNLTNCLGYSPVCAPTPAAQLSGRLNAQPAWYAMLLTHPLTGSRPLPTHLSRDGANIDALAFLAADGSVRLLLVDKDTAPAQAAAIMIHTRHYRHARALLLDAPTASATAGVTLGGSSVGPGGGWRASSTQLLAAQHGTIPLTLTPSSAVLLTLR